MTALRTCTVTIRDLNDVSHTLDVTAATLYEAVAHGALAAHAIGGSFCVFCDERRPDLIEQWYAVMSAIRGCTFAAG